MGFMRGRAVSEKTVTLVGLALVALSFLISEAQIIPLFRAARFGSLERIPIGLALVRLVLFNAGVLTLYYRKGIRGARSGGLDDDRDFFRALLLYSACFLLLVASVLFFKKSGGAMTLVFAALMSGTLVLTVKGALVLLARSFRRRIRLTALNLLALVAVSLTATGILVEVVLTMLSEEAPVHGTFSRNIVMPREFARREVKIEGAVSAFYWQGVLHVFNRDQMRVRGDFPAKSPGVFRIVAVGDSLTYGKGIAEEDTYARVLERRLQRTYRAEVLNLGVSASQSEDILEIVKKHLPRLEPDLVFYGACLNDFLPSRRMEYGNNYAYRVPFPYKRHFSARTLVGKLVAERYNDLLLKLGLRADFVTDILRDFEGYQVRFARDVTEMNAFVRSRGLPPVVAMVLYQFPESGSRAQEIVLLAEEYLRQAGMRVVPSDYLKEHDGRRDLHLNRWESHPNAEANRIFARAVLGTVEGLPELQRYRNPGLD